MSAAHKKQRHIQATAASSRRSQPLRIPLAGGSLLLVEPSHDVPLVHLTIGLRSGAAYDPTGCEGALRAALRMIRRGGAGMTAVEIEAALDRLGAELWVDVGTSHASLHGQVIARNLEPFMVLLANLLGTLTWDKHEYGRLLRETEAELLEERDSDRALAHKAFRRAIFGNHAYARSASGTLASLPKLKLTVAKEAFARHVCSSEMVFAFSGDIDAEEAKRAATKILAGVPRGHRLPEIVGPPTMRKGRHMVLVDKPERTQTQIALGTLGTAPRDPDYVALNVANAVFGGTFTSRLMNEVRSKRGWSYGASSRLAVDRQRHAFSVWTAPAAADCAPCLELEIGLYENFVQHGVTRDEAAFIKKYLVRSYAFEIDTASKRVHQALDVEILGLPHDFYTRYVQRVTRTTAREANLATARRLSTEDLVIVVVGTAQQIGERLRAVVPRLASFRIVPYDGD